MLRFLIATVVTLAGDRSRRDRHLGVLAPRPGASRAPLHPLAELLFRCILWVSTGQNRREWVAVHRKHHAFTDKEGDPDSPLLLGFWKVQLGNVFYYVREARNPETIARWAKDIKDDIWDRLIFNWGTAGAIVGVTFARTCCSAPSGGWGCRPRTSCYASCSPPPSTRWGTGGGGGTSSTTTRPISGSSPGSPVARACTNDHAYPSSLS